jgi:hypothetical protein
MGLEHIGYRGVGNVVTDVGQRTLNAIVSLGGILPGEANDGIHDNLSNPWPTGFAFVAGIEFVRHEFAVPAENRIWREDGRQFQQRLAADGVSLHCEEPSLVVIQQQSLPSELQQERLDLSVLELDDLLLPVIDHATEYGEQDVPGRKQERHIRRRTSASFRYREVKSSG